MLDGSRCTDGSSDGCTDDIGVTIGDSDGDTEEDAGDGIEVIILYTPVDG